MGPFIYTEPRVADTLQKWFASTGELFVELYRPHSGTGGDFYRLLSYADYQNLMERADPGAIVFVSRDRHFPLRGIVDDAFIRHCLEEIKDGESHLIIRPSAYPETIDYLGDGNSHAELKRDLQSARDSEVWVGRDFCMPDKYWIPNTAENALIATKPKFSRRAISSV